MVSIANFQEANDYLKSLYGNQRVKYSLGNIKRLMSLLDNPQDKFKAIHIAGTSGKTSTAYFMASLLKATNKKVGLTVSPILDEVNERVQINFEPLSETDFTNALTEFVNMLSDFEIKLSRFELLVAFAYWYFANQKVDYGVIEVGLGGLKDGTNVINRRDKVCLITDIGYDHVEILGKSLPEIASQKAGIILPDNEVFMYNQAPEIMSAITRQVEKARAHLNLAVETPNLDNDIPDYQHKNWELAYAAYKFLMRRDGLTDYETKQLDKTKYLQIPGRLEIKKYQGKTIILDGAHNTQKMTAFIDSFKKLYPNCQPAVLIAMRSNKDYQEVADLISKIASKVITTTFKAYQDTPLISLDADKLASAFTGIKAISIKDSQEALKTLLALDDDIVIITGSLYLLSQLRAEASFLK